MTSSRTELLGRPLGIVLHVPAQRPVEPERVVVLLASLDTDDVGRHLGEAHADGIRVHSRAETGAQRRPPDRPSPSHPSPTTRRALPNES